MDSAGETRLVEKTLEIGDRRISYAAGDGDGPPLLFIHGISGWWRDWLNVTDWFVDDWRVFAVDLRGHGGSSWVAEGDGYHWRNYALDQAEFIERVVGEATFVVGHSLGGATAIGLNALRSELVRAAVYEDPPLFVHRRWDGNRFRSAFSLTLEVMDAGGGFEALAAHVRETMPELEEARVRDRARKLSRMDPEVFRSTLSGRSRVDWRTEDLLARASSPGLLLQAEPELGAALNDAEAAEAMQILPDAEYEKWADSGHGMHAAFPERFATRVRGYFARYRDDG